MNNIEKDLATRKFTLLAGSFRQSESMTKSQTALLHIRRRILKKIMLSIQSRALKSLL